MTDPARLRQELEDIALAGHGFPVILRHLGVVSNRVVRLVAVHGGLLASSEDDAVSAATSVPASGVPASASLDRGLDPDTVRLVLARNEPTAVTCTDGMTARALPVQAGERRVGLLLMGQPVGPIETDLLRAAAVPLAIEAVRRDAEAAAIAESASRLVDEARFGSLRDNEQLVRAAQRFGLALDRPHAAAVFAYDGRNHRTWETAIRWVEMPVHEEHGRGWTILAGDVSAELRRIRDRLDGIVGGDAPVLAASGPVVEDVSATPRSFREAEVVLALLRQRPGDVVLPYDELGLQALLLSVPPARLRAFVDVSLGPIADKPDLISTLEAWYAANGSRLAVAERLGVHRNSVGYRVARLRKLLGNDPMETKTARQLQAALDAREVLRALDDIDED
ncbi:MAG TPA: helix-turn-helix domain-containing protein [Acidimicrobiia bacterium]|nr:helix-turn-helix domain-containing protein [Acidimicrobiia bacterium]